MPSVADNYFRHNVGHIVLLKERESGKEFIIANCHIFWNPAKSEVKLAQVRYLREKLVHIY